MRSPRARQGGSGFHHFPGDLSLSLEDLRARYRDDPQTWATFESWSQATRLDRRGTTVFDWLSGRKPDGTRPTRRPPVARTVRAVPPPAPVVPPARTMDSIVGDLERHALAADREVATIDAELAALGPVPTAGAAQDQWVARRLEVMRRREQLVSRHLAEQRAIVALPATERGQVTIVGTPPKSSAKRLGEGRAIVEALVHPSQLPAVSVEPLKGDRAFYRDSDRTVHINRGTSASVVAHEIGHAVELGTPEINTTMRALLQARSGGVPPKSLAALTGLGYRWNEVTWEDEWAKRGGDHYMGKVYARATELVSMGIERLWADPVGFARRDPQYFRTLLTALQKLP